MGLLVTVAIWALFVALAVWLPPRAGRFGFAIFVLTLTCNEIPLVLLAVFVLSVAATLVGAAPAEVVENSVAIGLAVLVVLALVWLQIRARTAAPALAAALDAALGSDGRQTRPLLPGTATDLRTPWWRGILLPFQRHAATVERTRGVPYAPGGRFHLLDIYRRSDGTTGRPVLIHLHGGGFVSGGKSRESVTLLNQLAAHGWFCVSANYGLRSEGAFPRSLVDTKRVIAWVRAHRDTHGTDPDQIFLAGASAGGHLAISAALTPGDAQFQPGLEEVDTHVAGAVALYGYLGARTADAASSPANLARPDAPPLLIVHGAKDTALPPGQARTVAESLRSVSRSPVVYAELPDTQHSFDLFASVRSRTAANAVESFLDRVRRSGGRGL